MNGVGWQEAEGVIARGYGVASGQGETPYPAGAIAIQAPHFRGRGFDLAGLYFGTLNVCVAPLRVTMLAPAHTFRAVRWTDLIPPEDFSFSPLRLAFRGTWHAGWIYYPHPETKPCHEQRDDMIEALMPRIGGIGYGDPIRVAVRRAEVALERPAQGG